MKRFLYGDGLGNFYCGRISTGRVKYTREFMSATLFEEKVSEDAEDCIDLGLSLYSIEISKPVLVECGITTQFKPAFE